MLQHFKAARRVGVPLIAINTPDPEATIATLCQAAPEDVAKVEWDFIRGLSARGESAKEFVASAAGEFDNTRANPVEALVRAVKLPAKAILFVHLAPRYLGEAAVIQAVWNLRDAFKQSGRTLVLLGRQVTLPIELQEDVLSIDEPLPTEEQLQAIVAEMHKAADVKLPPATKTKAAEALCGLSAFAAEQVTALSIRKTGLDLDGLWERKRQQIEQAPALKVFRNGSSFAEIGGCQVIKDFVTRIMAGNAAPRAVVFIDEIEKMLGGKGDTSGVSQDQLGILLSYMQDHQAAGMIFVGPPGAAKSAIAKAAGIAGGVPTIQLDLGAAKGSLVGQSEQQIRHALKVITAVSSGKSLWIATCNAIADLPPELRRRFTLGTFFFDLPDDEERAAIWNIYRGKFDCDGELPLDKGWTGAEVRQCCEISWRLGCPLKEAAEFVVPVSRSAPDQLQRLRDQADGRFLSASKPGVYRKDAPAPVAGSRSFSVNE